MSTQMNETERRVGFVYQLRRRQQNVIWSRLERRCVFENIISHKPYTELSASEVWRDPTT